jgi:hypothetical protein
LADNAPLSAQVNMAFIFDINTILNENNKEMSQLTDLRSQVDTLFETVKLKKKTRFSSCFQSSIEEISIFSNSSHLGGQGCWTQF